ncbi:MAG TPA: acyl-CoA dehydrogenase family protein [Rhizomicrobium sp.]|nr:acyl-CoA dehydrogenase family protein [Rhizomicrobium sp.]
MSAFRPQDRLETHQVTNQPPPFEDISLFDSDVVLREVLAHAGGGAHAQRLTAFGTRAGSAEVARWAIEANRNVPQLKIFDRFGQRIDEVEFHPAYHALMGLGFGAGVSSAAWSGIAHGHVLHAALAYLMSQAEPGVCCPMTMTYAALPALRQQPDVAEVWTPYILAALYDPASLPAEMKRGATIGMAMTEKQGGSDVRANTTRAEPISGASNGYILTGHKWFCSAPMSDAFLTLAYANKGLTCFLAPRWKPDGERNSIQIMRLKDKLGDRANASAEIEYHRAYAVRIGEEGRGVRTIVEMVHHTRLDCTVAPAAFMRQALANALWHTAHREAFQKKLIDQPLMNNVLADMSVESEAATALAFRIARSFDESATSREAAAFSRIATPIGKYWINKRVVNFVYEALEAHGGAGYVEESAMPRIFRQSPLNSIWEGSGNIICLDVLRAMMREKDTVPAFISELETALGENARLDAEIEGLKDRLVQIPDEREARHLVERMALALQASLLQRQAPAFVADAFCETRLGAQRALTYGALASKMDTPAIIGRAMPAV